MKDTFIISTEDADLIDELNDEQAGVLFKAIMASQMGCDPPEMDKETKIIFSVMLKRINRFNDRYAEKCKRRAEAGKLGGEAKAAKAKQSVANVANAKDAKQSVANVANLAEPEPEPDPDPEPDINKNILLSSGSTAHAEKPEMSVPAAAGIIIAHLNEKTGGHYQPDSKETLELIRRRMKAGFKVNDFIIVIDKKTREWKGTDMEQFLRPVTLFSTKFENYLNAPEQRARAKPGRDKGHNFEERKQDWNLIAQQMIDRQGSLAGS